VNNTQHFQFQFCLHNAGLPMLAAIAILWSLGQLYSIGLKDFAASMFKTSPSILKETPSVNKSSAMLSARLLSLCISLCNPQSLLFPLQLAAKIESIGNKSGQSVRSASKGLSFLLWIIKSSFFHSIFAQSLHNFYYFFVGLDAIFFEALIEKQNL